MAETTSVISLRDNNPYANGRVLVFDDGTEELERDFPEYKGTEKDKYYTVQIGDTTDQIAWWHYKDIKPNAEKYWWVICDANDIENPLDLSSYVGTDLVIPDLPTFELIYSR